jgi:hypothetical protein
MSFAMSNVWGQLGNAMVFFLLPFIARGGLTLATSTSFLYTRSHNTCVVLLEQMIDTPLLRSPHSVSAFAWVTCLVYVFIDGPALRQRIGGISSSGEGSKMRLSDIREFPASYWSGVFLLHFVLVIT